MGSLNFGDSAQLQRHARGRCMRGMYLWLIRGAGIDKYLYYINHANGGGGSASVPCCGDLFTFGRCCWADTAYRCCFTLNRADILCHHVLLLSTCLPFVAMRSSVLPFFGFVIAHFSSSSLIYHSFFLTVAHLLLTFFFPLSLVYLYLWRDVIFLYCCQLVWIG